MNWAMEEGNALAELDLAPSQQQVSASNGNVQPLQPNGQQVRASRGIRKRWLRASR